LGQTGPPVPNLGVVLTASLPPDMYQEVGCFLYCESVVFPLFFSPHISEVTQTFFSSGRSCNALLGDCFTPRLCVEEPQSFILVCRRLLPFPDSLDLLLPNVHHHFVLPKPRSSGVVPSFGLGHIFGRLGIFKLLFFFRLTSVSFLSSLYSSSFLTAMLGGQRSIFLLRLI